MYLASIVLQVNVNVKAKCCIGSWNMHILIKINNKNVLLFYEEIICLHFQYFFIGFSFKSASHSQDSDGSTWFIQQRNACWHNDVPEMYCWRQNRFAFIELYKPRLLWWNHMFLTTYSECATSSASNVFPSGIVLKIYLSCCWH